MGTGFEFEPLPFQVHGLRLLYESLMSSISSRPFFSCVVPEKKMLKHNFGILVRTPQPFPLKEKNDNFRFSLNRLWEANLAPAGDVARQRAGSRAPTPAPSPKNPRAAA